MEVCPYDPNHTVPWDRMEKHKASCQLSKMGYSKEEQVRHHTTWMPVTVKGLVIYLKLLILCFFLPYVSRLKCLILQCIMRTLTFLQLTWVSFFLWLGGTPFLQFSLLWWGFCGPNFEAGCSCVTVTYITYRQRYISSSDSADPGKRPSYEIYRTSHTK